MNIKSKHYLLPFFLLLLVAQVSFGLERSTNTEQANSTAQLEAESIFRTKPFLQNPIGGGITISWFTKVPTHGWVEFGTDENLGTKAETRIAGQVVANVKQHQVRLDGLQPGQSYYYRVCSREVLVYGAYKKEFGEVAYSDVYEFTLPDTKSADFTAIIFNDLHQKRETLQQLMTQLEGVNYDFVIYNGDCIDDPSSEDQALSFLSYSNEQVKAEEKPVFYIRGNHEIRGAYSVELNQLFDYVGGKTYGAFNWGNTRFVLLDCGEDKPDSHPVYYGLNSFEQLRNDQLDFLRDETKSKAFKKAAKRVLIHHIPLYGMDEKYYLPCADLWGETLNKGRVAVAINGHTHSYAYHEAGSLGNNYPVVIGGGYSANNATVMILEKVDQSLHLKAIGYDGTVLGDYHF
ncbi:FN3 domain-containing metallophosphoesterase family protein [Sunxiuqinia elliptica]|uniref:3',5'-cyclic AMP phosphodiesterase CpdA n=1 Tax=Sunxiuqinia elliptica TaxID=655355 RepID=A0A1I2K7I6_9BACT|nr:FN3 domain-containing metallophosphoesterase family protein [Sunxiuqinia elliptica]SFF62288.1 3',5'-cyclic AMP phosphodiesterase CpdA [Sunxiuqinia elliptica]